MGQRKSKSKSYDIAPVVSDKDFKYERAAPRSSPDLTVPPPVAEPETVEPTYDTKSVPAWVTEELFVDVLKTRVPGFEKITDFKAYSALKPGENYATIMLRVGVDVELKDHTKEHVSFMMKVPHDSVEMRQMQAMMNFFLCENTMYFEVFPELEQIYKEAGVELRLVPKAYQLPEAPDSYVLLEDLRPYGFKNANRLECLDMEHTQLVLRKMAQFHAVSAHRVATIGPFSDVVMKGFFSENLKPVLEGMIDSFKTAFLNNVTNYKDGEKYKKIMEEMFPRLADGMVDMWTYDENEFNVINHGDCWSNNILFKYDDNGKVIDLIFVDFQGPKFGPPSQDLYYFLLTSARIDIKLKQFDYLIRYYYDHLIENLTLLHYPKAKPTMRDLQVLLIKYGTFAAMPCVITLPVVLYDSTEMAHIDNFISSNDDGMKFKNLLFTNKRYRDYIEEILPWLHNRGLLEISAKNHVEPIGVTDMAAPITQTANPVPEWVNEEYFAGVLQKHVKNFKRITSFNAKPGTSSGDNYAATLLQIDIVVELEDDSSKDLSFMLKVAPVGDQANTVMDALATFAKETVMYNEFLPLFEQLYKDAGCAVTFGPQYFETPNEVGSKIILLENLRPRGFKNANRLEGLDMEHTKCALEKLAQFHAASAYYRHVQKRDYPKVFLANMFSEEFRPMLDQMQDSFYNPFMDAAQNYEGSAEYIQVLRDSKTRQFDKMHEMMKKEAHSFCVLNHGDMWTNNIMYQYDADGKIENTYLVDFQMMRYGAPAQDLYSLLLASPRLDIKLEHFEYFVRYYHENLVKFLNVLNYDQPIPSLKDFHSDMLKYGSWGYFAACGHLGAVLLEQTENANIDNFLGDGQTAMDFKAAMFSNERYRAHAEVILPWLHKRGLLNFELDNAVPTKSVTPSSNVPSWVDADHFNDILAANVEGFAKIKSVEASTATKAGDNYASQMLRVKVIAELADGSETKRSYMLKMPLVSDQGDAMSALWNFFPKELAMYTEIIPAFESMYKERGSAVVFAPKVFQFSKDTGCETVLMEDLHDRNFENMDRLQGLDTEHTRCVLRKLAQFHAASAKHFETHGAYSKIFDESFYNESSREFMGQLMKQSDDLFIECVSEYEGSDEYQHKMRNARENFISKIIELSKIDPAEFNVLNHGDCWLNNIMFQHDAAGHVTETYFVDFQVSKYGSPAHDLYYLLLSSTQFDIRVEHFDEFIKYYHDHLIENLQLLQYAGPVPTLKELHCTMLKYGFLGFASLTGIAAICSLEPTANANFDTFTADTAESYELRKALYANPRYRPYAEVGLKWLNRRGCLDI